mgnify:FL=1
MKKILKVIEKDIELKDTTQVESEEIIDNDKKIVNQGEKKSKKIKDFFNKEQVKQLLNKIINTK